MQITTLTLTSLPCLYLMVSVFPYSPQNLERIALERILSVYKTKASFIHSFIHSFDRYLSSATLGQILSWAVGIKQ